MTRQRKLWFAALLLACIHGVILFAGFVAPYGYADQFRAHPFAAPTRLHFVDSSGAFHLRPFVYVQPGFSNSFVNPEDALQTYPIRFLAHWETLQVRGNLHRPASSFRRFRTRADIPAWHR